MTLLAWLLLGTSLAAALLLGLVVWAARELRMTLRWLSQPFPQRSAELPNADSGQNHEKLV